MAENKKEQNPAPQPHHSKTWEWLQNIGLFAAFLLGIQKNAPTVPAGDGNGVGKIKEMPAWLMNMFPSFTREDETEFNLILDSYPSAKQVEAEFRARFIADGYDETKYRLALVHMRREYVERMAKTMPKNDLDSRMTFAKLEMRDSAYEFLSELVVESAAGGDFYRRQKERALSRKILEEPGIADWVKKNKGKTLALLAISPFVLITFAYHLLNLIFG